MTETKSPVDQLLPVIHEAMDSWHKKNTPSEITRRIHTRLDKASDQVVFKLLGFDRSYSNSWQLDHCNGRSGNSIAGTYLADAQEQAVHQWLEEVSLPELSPEEKTKLQEELHREYVKGVRANLMKMVRTRVTEDINKLLDEVSQSFEVDNYGKLLELIQPKEEHHD